MHIGSIKDFASPQRIIRASRAAVMMLNVFGNRRLMFCSNKYCDETSYLRGISGSLGYVKLTKHKFMVCTYNRPLTVVNYEVGTPQ